MLQSKTDDYDVKKQLSTTTNEISVDEQIHMLASVIIELLLNENIVNNEEF